MLSSPNDYPISEAISRLITGSGEADTPPPGSSMLVEDDETLESVNASTTPTFAKDFSAYDVGDVVYMIVGRDGTAAATGVTVNGNPATGPLYTTATTNICTVWSYTLQAGENVAGIAVVATFPSALTGCVCDFTRTQNANAPSFASTWRNPMVANSESLTATEANNFAKFWAYGHDGSFTGGTGLTTSAPFTRQRNVVARNTAAYAVSTAADQTPGAITCNYTPVTPAERGVAMLMLFEGSGGGGPMASTFTVETSRTTVLVGEAAHLAILGDGGHTVTDEVAEIWIEVDLDQPGMTYERPILGRNNANTQYGRNITAVWTTPGTKTITINSWTYSGDQRQQTVEITVEDLSSVTWDKIAYVDLTGDTTDMPPEAGNVDRILSWAEWDALDNTAGVGHNWLIYWRRGVTHNVQPTNTDTWRQNAALVYHRPFGTGARPVIRSAGTNTTGVYRLTHPRTANQRVIFSEIEADGNWDHISGDYGAGPFELGYTDQTGTEFTFYRCKVKGAHSFCVTTNAATMDDRGTVALFDCAVEDAWKDYAVLANSKWVGAVGCDLRQDPLTGKEADAKSTTPSNKTDHSALRISGTLYANAQQNLMRVIGGWSPLVGSEPDTQPGIRDHPVDNPVSGAIDNFLRTYAFNEFSGSRLAIVGKISSGGTGINGFGDVLVFGNAAWLGRAAGGQGGGPFVTTEVGGIKMLCNAVMRSAARNLQTDNAMRINFLGLTEQGGGIGATARARPIVVNYNSLISDLAVANNLTETYTLAGTGWVVSTSDNLLSGPNHGNGASLLPAGDLSPGFYARAVTGGAGDVAGVADPPYVDFYGMVRTATTRQGAHEAAGALVTLTDPVYTSGLTIGLVDGRYQVTDWGTWSGDFRPELGQFDWTIDGGDPASGANDRKLSFFDGADTGDLQLTFTAHVIGGTAGAGASNVITLT